MESLAKLIPTQCPPKRFPSCEERDGRSMTKLTATRTDRPRGRKFEPRLPKNVCKKKGEELSTSCEILLWWSENSLRKILVNLLMRNHDSNSFFAYCDVTVTDIAFLAVAVIVFALLWRPKLKGMILAICLHFLPRQTGPNSFAQPITTLNLFI